MMLWRSLSGRTICEAADAVAARRVGKGTAKPAAPAKAPGPVDSGKVAGTILPANTASRTSGSV